MMNSFSDSHVVRSLPGRARTIACCAGIVLMLTSSAWRRTALAIDEAESLGLLVKTLDTTDDPAVRKALMRGMLSGLEGRRNLATPKGWNELSVRLARSRDENVRDLSNQLSRIFGDTAAVERAVALVRDTSVEPGKRRQTLRSLLTQQNRKASSLLESLLDEPDLRLDAIRGYAMVENATAPAVLLERYRKFSPEHRRAVVETLAARKTYAEVLLTAIEQKTVSRDEIPPHVARSLNTILGERFVKAFGQVRPVSRDREQLIAKYRKMITPDRIAGADAARGRAVFNRTCAACHVMYGTGGKIGPELTGSNRANLEYILLNSVDPSYDVPAGYRMVSIVTVNGRLINGVVAEENGTRIVLKTVEQPRVVIAKEDIEIRKVSPKSMMPEGQFEKMKPQELFDLIRYLRTTEQVEVAE